MNKKTIKLLGFAGVALLAVVGVLLFGVPFFNQTQTWASEIEMEEESRAQLETQLQSLQNVQAQQPEVQAINDELAVRFPNLPRGTDLLQNISIAAATVGIGGGGIESISITPPVLIVAPVAEAAPEEPVEGETPAEGEEAPVEAPVEEVAPTSNVASMEISLTISGTSEQLLAFTTAFNNMERTIKVSTANVTAADENGSSTLSLTGVAYLYASIEPPVIPEEETTAEEQPAEEPGIEEETG